MTVLRITVDNTLKMLPILFGAAFAFTILCGWMYRRAFILSFGIDTLAIDVDAVAYFQMSDAHFGALVIFNYINNFHYQYLLPYLEFIVIIIEIPLIAYALFERVRSHFRARLELYRYTIALLLLCAIFAILIKTSINLILYASVYAQQEVKDTVTNNRLPVVKFLISDRSLNMYLDNLNKKMRRGSFREILMDRKNIYIYDNDKATCKQTDEKCNLSLEVMIVPLDKITGLTVVADL